MRNYFENLNIRVTATQQQITDALKPGSPALDTLEAQHRKDAYQVLLDDDQRQLYVDTVMLYEALNTASSRLQSNGGIDTNRWLARLAEFDTRYDDILAPPLEP